MEIPARPLVPRLILYLENAKKLALVILQCMHPSVLLIEGLTETVVMLTA